MLASTRKAAIPFLLLAVSLVVFPFRALAQVNSNVGNVILNANVSDSVSVTPGVGTVNFTLLPGAAVTGAPQVPIATSWNVNPGHVGSMKLYAYFDSSTVALTDGTDNIPSADVLGSVNSGGFTALTQTGPFGAAGASLLLFTEAIGGANKIKTRNDTLDVRVDLTGLPLLPAGTYTGTMRIQAQAL
jgi:hypothetical protein